MAAPADDAGSDWSHESFLVSPLQLLMIQEAAATEMNRRQQKQLNAPPRRPSNTSLISRSSSTMSHSCDSQASQNTSRFSLAILLDGWRASVWAAEMIWGRTHGEEGWKDERMNDR